MKFAHYLYVLERDAPPEWSGKFIKYKYLKKMLKECVRDQDLKDSEGDEPLSEKPALNTVAEEAFFVELRSQLNATNKYFQKQADKTITAFQRTQRYKCFCCFFSFRRAGPHEYSQLAEHAYWCRKFARCNAVALRKILKKHDKVCGNAKGRAFLQSCWNMEGTGRSVGLFLHSPVLDELKAVQDLLQERLAEYAQADVAQIDDNPSDVAGNAYMPEAEGQQLPGVEGDPGHPAEQGQTSLVAENLERHNEHHYSQQKLQEGEADGAPSIRPSGAVGGGGVHLNPIRPSPFAAGPLTVPAGIAVGILSSVDEASALSPTSLGLHGALDQWESSSSIDVAVHNNNINPDEPTHTKQGDSSATHHRRTSSGNDQGGLIEPDTTSSVSLSGFTGPSGSWKVSRHQPSGPLAAIMESPTCLLDTSDFEWAGPSEPERMLNRAASGSVVSGGGGSDQHQQQQGRGGRASIDQQGDAEAPTPPRKISTSKSATKDQSGNPLAPTAATGTEVISPRHGSFKIEDLRCPICLEIMYKPVGLGCGHKFCRPCALEAAGFGHAVGAFFNIITHIPHTTPCPQCRQTRVYESAIYLQELGALIKNRFPEEWAERRKEDKGKKQLHIGYLSPMLGGPSGNEEERGRRLQSRSRRRLMGIALGPITPVLDD